MELLKANYYTKTLKIFKNIYTKTLNNAKMDTAINNIYFGMMATQ